MHEHQPRLAMHKFAAAKLHLLDALTPGGVGIRSTRFSTLLQTAFVKYADMQLQLSRPQSMGMAAAGLMDCCIVCRQGHQEFLVQQGAVIVSDSGPELVCDSGTSAASAVADPVQQPDAGGIPGRKRKQGNSSQGRAAPQQQTLRSPHAPQLPKRPCRQHASSEPQQARGQQNEQQPPVQGQENPAAEPSASDKRVFASYGAALVVHNVIIDGLQKLRHLAKAGALPQGGCWQV
jgi:hypothetical protein